MRSFGKQPESVRKKQRRRGDHSPRRPYFMPLGPPKLAERVVVLACTRSNHRFCIPKPLCGESAPVSTQFVFTPCGVLTPGAVRFLLWWLFLHRRLRSRQRGSRTSFRFSRAAWHSMADHFHGALPVFIRATQVSLSADPSKPFGFGSGRTRQRLSAPSVLKRLRHHTRSTFRCRSKCP